MDRKEWILWQTRDYGLNKEQTEESKEDNVVDGYKSWQWQDLNSECSGIPGSDVQLL